MMFEPRAKGLGKENFLKLNDKEEVTGIFQGPIHIFKRHWKNNKSLECIGDNCSVCAVDPENYPSFRFRVNFITSKDGTYLSKIFEGGGELYDQLTNLDKKFDLSKTVVDIMRTGLKQNTKYQIVPRTDVSVTKEFDKTIKGITLLALCHEKEAVSA